MVMSRVPVVVLILMLLPVFMACNINMGSEETDELSQAAVKTPEGARETISRLNIPYTVDEFVNRAKQSDAVVVTLFLTAGMNPNARDKDGVTALMAATEEGHTGIVELLKEAGAEE